MILDELKRLLTETKPTGAAGTAVRIKDRLQDYILNFVYNHRKYKQLIFTGGTCLRKVYGLPRLSEDVDFDFTDEFEIDEFADEAVGYFVKNLQYKAVEAKIAKNRKTVFLKFPALLTELGLVKNSGDRKQLFVRCDLAAETTGFYTTEAQAISTSELTFFVKSYDLPTLFANKIIAFLERDFFRGKTQKTAFKGRDVFDLVWLFERRQKSGLELAPKWDRVVSALAIDKPEDAVRMLVDKVGRIDPADVRRDLEPFVESGNTAAAVGRNFKQVIESGARSLIGNFSFRGKNW